MAEDELEELKDYIAALEGRVAAHALMIGMLFEAARTSQSFDSLYERVRSIQQLFDDSVPTLFPERRIFFIHGYREGVVEARSLADFISRVMAGYGHSSSL